MLSMGTATIEQLAAARAGTDKLREQIVSLLLHWFTVGFMKPELVGQASAGSGKQ